MNTGIFVLGVVLIILGAVAYGYTVTETNTYFFGAFSDSNASQPYVAYSWPLFIAGLVLLVIGAAMPSSHTRTHHTVVDEPTTGRRRTKTVVEEESED